MLFEPQTLHGAICLKDRGIYLSQLTTNENSLQSSYESSSYESSLLRTHAALMGHIIMAIT